MRQTNDYNQRENCVEFVRDLDYGIIISMPSGLQLVAQHNPHNDGLLDVNERIFHDPVTNKEVFYPGWCEW